MRWCLPMFLALLAVAALERTADAAIIDMEGVAVPAYRTPAAPSFAFGEYRIATDAGWYLDSARSWGWDELSI